MDAMERLADTVTGGERDDDDNTGRKLVPGTSSVVVVTCDLLVMERSETWR